MAGPPGWRAAELPAIATFAPAVVVSLLRTLS